ERDDDHGGRPAAPHARSDGGADQGRLHQHAAVAPPVPVRHVHEHHRRRPARREGDGLKERTTMSLIEHDALSRRTFLKAGGALVVTAAVPAVLGAPLARAAAGAGPYPDVDPTSLATWLSVHADGTVIARSGHVELGHGVQTGLAQIVAEELDVPFASVTMVLGNTRETPDQ